MAGTIKCPVCGENNSSDLDYCQNCNSPLQPHDEPLKPGELPNKKKNTAELEPILPQWLRDAREQSRQTAQDEPFQGMEPLKSQPSNEPAVPAPGMDFLAGLQSHANDDGEDETPDWLASITGVSNKPKKTEVEASDVRWVEMGGKDDFAQDNPIKDTGSLQTPSWLADIQSQPKTEKDELTDWFKEASNPSTSSSQQPGWLDEPEKDINFGSKSDESALMGDTPDWLRQMQADNAEKDEFSGSNNAFSSSEDTPDWLKSMGANDAQQESQSSFASGFDTSTESPDWLKRMDTNASVQNNDINAGQAFSSTEDYVPAWLQQPGSQQQSDDDAPGWLNNIDAGSNAQSPFSDTTFDKAGDDFSSNDAAPDWLKSMQSEEPAPPPLKGTSPLWLRDESASDAADANVPAWLSSTNPIENESPFPEIKSQEAESGDIPNWLKAAAPQSSIFSDPAPQEDQTFSSDTPDWLSSFKSVEGSQPASPFASDTPVEDELPTAAFTENSFEDAGDNSLFNEMPDWLSNAAETPASTESPLTGNDTEAIAASELPSWVQAMRPVDGGPRGGATTDQTLESRGALAGLQGVLPSVPGYTPSSKPKAYSILLQATEEQKSQALLLEQILGAEAEPQPIASYAPLAVSRSLRWFLAATLLVLVTLVTVLHTQRFGMPFLSMDTPNELKGALDVAQNVPEGAPVLVVMDYGPSHAAELEAAVAPMLDQMDLLRHPRLMFVSTNEMGMVLAERMMALPFLKDRYLGEGQLTNLGYLPGGEMGIRAFVLDPSETFQQDMFRNPTPLQPGISIAQFVAILLLTDNADSGRIWIEQISAAPVPVPAPVVLVTSAQAAPMSQPYYVSGQIKGIVSGLYGSAVFEQNNAGRPGIARSYWDAYSMGIWLAMLVLLIGGLWNLAMGARDRIAAREAL